MKEDIFSDIYNHPLVTTGSWVEDWPKYENGRYLCKCVDCNGTFIGHKRRVVCKTCTIKRFKNTPHKIVDKIILTSE